MHAEASLPSWECGLKYIITVTRETMKAVAPFVGVWIEISTTTQRLRPTLSLPSWECGLKYHIFDLYLVYIYRRSLRGSVDWNYDAIEELKDLDMSLPSWECGLKYKTYPAVHFELCRSLRGSVDWNDYKSSIRYFSKLSLPSWECGLKL